MKDLAKNPEQCASNVNFPFMSGKQQKGDLLLKLRNYVTLHSLEICGFYIMLFVNQIAFTSVPRKCLSHFRHLLQGHQQTNFLLIMGQNPDDDDLNSPVGTLPHRNHLWF